MFLSVSSFPYAELLSNSIVLLSFLLKPTTSYVAAVVVGTWGGDLVVLEENLLGL